MLKFEEIIAGCLNQNSKSKEMVYKSFYGYLMAVVLRYVNERNDAEELVNDSFIKIFKAIVQFNLPKNTEEHQRAFKAWIAKIASRTAIDFLRTKRSLLSIDEITEHQEPLTEVTVIAALNVKDILKLLDALPETQKLIFNLFEIEGFSHDEISKILNIPESSSRVYLARAKNKLRTLYSKTLINSYATN
ncbi:RNA polymerase sigma factor [Pedobacter sp. UC225_65]|uniref:RNA polymerase sigma factor n=1 Tax=Pedobacter sp. UC225_65 TaxID=3350173 RepID=UPI00366F63B3